MAPSHFAGVFMDLKTYLSLKPKGGSTEFATRMGISISYLSQLASGKAPISPARATSIERFTDRAVTRQELRPDDWMDIWPELIPKDALSDGSVAVRADGIRETCIRPRRGASYENLMSALRALVTVHGGSWVAKVESLMLWVVAIVVACRLIGINAPEDE